MAKEKNNYWLVGTTLALIITTCFLAWLTVDNARRIDLLSHPTTTTDQGIAASNPFDDFQPKCVSWTVTGHEAVLHDTCVDACNSFISCMNLLDGADALCDTREECERECNIRGLQKLTAEIKN